jgi:hypothetical protein
VVWLELVVSADVCGSALMGFCMSSGGGGRASVCFEDSLEVASLRRLRQA